MKKNHFDILSQSKSSFIILSASLLIMISMLSLDECITRSSSLSMEEINLFLLFLIEFSMCQIFLDYLERLLNMV